jgi:hypothetical protein
MFPSEPPAIRIVRAQASEKNLFVVLLLGAPSYSEGRASDTPGAVRNLSWRPPKNPPLPGKNLRGCS